ncbi:hypothetical protein R4Z10_15865 [Niallia sp. XMNu-256]|uniref:hypothetical protein n=1 Tax=Niallia sp. XMNu-256 TaxID=3082444 RepID=UPI0030D4927F
MRRLVAFLVIIMVLYVIYFDLSHGTLPAVTTEQKTEVKNDRAQSLPYFEKTVQNGDTVLSIIENQLEDSIPVPITEVVSDFKKLNDNLPPQEIQSGKKYKFPDYHGED